MRTFIIIGAIFALAGAVFLFTPVWHKIREVYMEDRAVRAERLFKDYGGDIFRLAQKIEWGDEVKARDITPVKERINERFGEEITLLFHALGSANITAIDVLIGAGADVTMIDRPSEGSQRDFVYFLGLPGGDLLDQDGINEVIRIYLKYGGDPNYRMQGNYARPLIREVGLMDNIDGVRILLEAGADPWATSVNIDGDPTYESMMIVINDDHDHDHDQDLFMDDLIDQGYFNNKTQGQIFNFLRRFGGYAQRGDETSKEIQRISMRILKRNPHYVEKSDRQATARIFKNHWKDLNSGVIPWDIIKSDAVK